MHKKIEDYLHLYLGCEVEIEIYGKVRQVKFTGISDNYYYLHVPGDHSSTSYWKEKYQIKPILRPLSDMTEEESEFQSEASWQGKPTILMNAEITIYLLSKRFDLFGLIPAGLAIDATTLNQPK